MSSDSATALMDASATVLASLAAARSAAACVQKHRLSAKLWAVVEHRSARHAETPRQRIKVPTRTYQIGAEGFELARRVAVEQLLAPLGRLSELGDLTNPSHAWPSARFASRSSNKAAWD